MIIFGFGNYQSNGGWSFINNDGAYLWFEYGINGNYLRWFIENTYVNSGYTPFPTSQWHVYDVCSNASRKGIFIDMDNTQILSGYSSSAVTTPKNIFFGRHSSAGGTANVSADWILVRKYTVHEPVQGMMNVDMPINIPLLTASDSAIVLSPKNNSTIHLANRTNSTMNESVTE